MEKKNKTKALEDTPENSTELKPLPVYPLNLREMRSVYRFHFNTNPDINAQIEEMSHICFKSFTQDNKLFQLIGYHFFRQLVINSAREFFLMGNAFLNWNGIRKNFEILDPDRVRVCASPTKNLMYYHDTAPNKKLDNFYHLARRLAPYDILGISVITMENMADPHISNIGLENYVFQFIDAWVNSGIQNFNQIFQ